MEDHFLQSFVAKVTAIQQERKQKPLSQEELKAIAESLGIGQQDWQAVEEAFQKHLAHGTQFLSHQNWEDAIQELEQAYVLQRTNDLVLYGLALAYANRWREYRREKDIQKAFDFIKSLLQHHPKHEQAIDLQSQLRREEKSYHRRKRQQRRVTIIAFGTVFLVVVILFLELFYPSRQQSPSSLPSNDVLSGEKQTVTKENTEKLSQNTPVLEEDGSKTVLVEWVENALSEGIAFEADKAALEVYDHSFSLIAAVRILPVNQEITAMKLKYEWLDAKNQPLFEKTEEVVSSYAATV
ncbi:MAG: hypothetical protein NZ521_01340, partial [Flammeovirgaceae bacterium]|nr:hypothetical protein [Flammeovirgaceae bacterium]MDW8286759.1 hypothetical protein [Flammeovirgaceae bacterium]